MPLLVQLFLWFFVLPELLPQRAGLWLKQLPHAPFCTAAVGVGLFMSARVAVQLQAGIGSLPRGQRQAATALGLTTLQTYRYVLLPMAFRIILPPLTSEFLSTIKNTAVAITIGLVELTGAARSMQEFSFQVFEAFTAATRDVSAGQSGRRHRHAFRRARGGDPRLYFGEVRGHVRQFRFRRHPPLAALSLLRRHDLHVDADGALRARRTDLRYADRADAALRLPAARPDRRSLCRPHALAAAGAGDLLVLFPDALYRAMADGRPRVPSRSALSPPR